MAINLTDFGDNTNVNQPRYPEKNENETKPVNRRKPEEPVESVPSYQVEGHAGNHYIRAEIIPGKTGTELKGNFGLSGGKPKLDFHQKTRPDKVSEITGVIRDRNGHERCNVKLTVEPSERINTIKGRIGDSVLKFVEETTSGGEKIFSGHIDDNTLNLHYTGKDGRYNLHTAEADENARESTGTRFRIEVKTPPHCPENINSEILIPVIFLLRLPNNF